MAKHCLAGVLNGRSLAKLKLLGARQQVNWLVFYGRLLYARKTRETNTVKIQSSVDPSHDSRVNAGLFLQVCSRQESLGRGVHRIHPIMWVGKSRKGQSLALILPHGGRLDHFTKCGTLINNGLKPSKGRVGVLVSHMSP